MSMTHTKSNDRTVQECNAVKTNRREFLAIAAGVTLGAGLSYQTSCTVPGAREEAGPLPIVDTHQHLWDLTRFNPPWLADAPAILRRTYVTRDYLAACGDLNVVKAVYMEIDAHPDRHVDEARHVIELCKSAAHPTAAAVISGRPESARFAEYIRQFRNQGHIRGVRRVLHVPETARGFCLDDQFVRNVQLLGELDLSFDLCMRPGELTDGATLAERCPDTRFIVDHCGNADVRAFLPAARSGGAPPSHDVARWQMDMSRLAGHGNVICKISGIVASAPPGWSARDLRPIVDFCLDAFGPDRVVFGSDWPVCKLGATYGEWVGALKTITATRPLGARRKLFHDNAVKFYGLS